MPRLRARKCAGELMRPPARFKKKASVVSSFFPLNIIKSCTACTCLTSLHTRLRVSHVRFQSLLLVFGYYLLLSKLNRNSCVGYGIIMLLRAYIYIVCISGLFLILFLPCVKSVGRAYLFSSMKE